MAAKTGNAALVGLIGDPLGHSLSPLIHEYWIARHGLDAVYLPFRQNAQGDFPTLLAALSRLDVRGFNITVPYKEAVLAHVGPNAVARSIGAVNTVVIDGNEWRGLNTDAPGFVQSVKPFLDPSGFNVRLLGSGGAARAVAAGLMQAGVARLSLVNRSEAKAAALIADLASLAEVTVCETLPWEQREEGLEECDLLVNTTILGMKGKEALPISLERLPAHAAVADIVYAPLETPLLAAARSRGLIAIDGLGMLLGQAALAFEAWFGILPEINDELRRRVGEAAR